MVVLIQPEIPHTIEELERTEARGPVINTQGPMILLVKLVFGAVKVIPQLEIAFIAHCACHQTQHHCQKPFECALLLRIPRPLTVHRITSDSVLMQCWHS